MKGAGQGEVRFQNRKYGGDVHRTWKSFGPLPAEGFLLFGQPRTVMHYPATEEQIVFEQPDLHIVQPGTGRLVTMWFGANGDLAGIYIDVCLPPVFDPGSMCVDYTDLDLDVRVHLEGDRFVPQVLDREEFDRHARELRYPPALQAFARGSLRAVMSDIANGRPPFDRQSGRWHLRLGNLLAAGETRSSR